MGELQADHKAAIVAECRFVRLDELLAQSRHIGLRVIGEIQLARVGASIATYGNGLAAPDQLAAAFATAPAPERVLAGPPIGLPIPALHRQDADAVADIHAFELEGGAERRVGTVRNDVVAGHVDAERRDMRAQPGDAAERRNFRIFAELHPSVPSYGFCLAGWYGACLMRSTLNFCRADLIRRRDPRLAGHLAYAKPRDPDQAECRPGLRA